MAQHGLKLGAAGLVIRNAQFPIGVVLGQDRVNGGTQQFHRHLVHRHQNRNARTSNGPGTCLRGTCQARFNIGERRLGTQRDRIHAVGHGLRRAAVAARFAHQPAGSLRAQDPVRGAAERLPAAHCILRRDDLVRPVAVLVRKVPQCAPGQRQFPDARRKNLVQTAVCTIEFRVQGLHLAAALPALLVQAAMHCLKIRLQRLQFVTGFMVACIHLAMFVGQSIMQIYQFMLLGCHARFQLLLACEPVAQFREKLRNTRTLLRIGIDQWREQFARFGTHRQHTQAVPMRKLEMRILFRQLGPQLPDAEIPLANVGVME
ncbi:hypothetical protein D9M72_185600 [compost metagenome]